MSRPQGSGCDIGAYEYKTPGPVASLGISSGSGQHTGPGMTFAVPLKVYVLDNAGSPVEEVDVTFSAPASGASGVFANGSASIMVMTDGSGIAGSSLVANDQVGDYVVTAVAAGLPDPVEFALGNSHLFVNSTCGSDAGDCRTPTYRCRTIDGAISKAVAGDVIQVAGGTYTVDSWGEVAGPS